MSENEVDERAFPLMKPRDILTPTAAILGLSVTSIALIVSIMPQNPDIVRNFAAIMIGVVILFVVTAITTSLATFLRRESIWRIAVLLYIVGWFYLGGVLLILFIGYATGIESFQLPQFNISVGLGVPFLGTLIVGILFGAWVILRLRDLTKKLIQIKETIPKVDREKAREEASRVLAIEKRDVPMSVVKTTMEIERKLREMALLRGIEPRRESAYFLSKKLLNMGVIDKPIFRAISTIWNVRNAIVHARPFSKSEAMAALDLATTVLVALEGRQ